MALTESESMERAIHEEVALSQWDACWPASFEVERARLCALFPTQLLEVQHIGSTAVPGLAAKPVIDILAGVASMEVADALVAPLLNAGYTTSAAFNATLANRRWFMRWADGRRTHHLHVVVHGSNEWRDRLRFRDALRQDAALAARYASLKRELALAHRSDREVYTDGKTAFVAQVLSAP